MRLALLGLLLPIATLTAQSQPSELRPGARVRVTAPGILAGQPVTMVVSRTADSLVVASAEMTPVSIPIARITSLEVGHGSSRMDGSLRGLPWGTGIGTVFGVATASALKKCRTVNSVSTCDQPASSGDKNAWVAASAISGALYGLLIGAFFPVEKWDSLALTPRTSLDVQGRSAGVSWSLAF